MTTRVKPRTAGKDRKANSLAKRQGETKNLKQHTPHCTFPSVLLCSMKTDSNCTFSVIESLHLLLVRRRRINEKGYEERIVEGGIVEGGIVEERIVEEGIVSDESTTWLLFHGSHTHTHTPHLCDSFHIHFLFIISSGIFMSWLCCHDWIYSHPKGASRLTDTPSTSTPNLCF